MRLLQKQLPGFTLIELIITVAISALVVGGSIAGFIGFSDRQEVLNTAKEVQQMMRTAQSRARVRNTPTGCSSLSSYQVSFIGTSSVRLSTVCGVTVTEITTVAFPSGVTINNTTALRFTTLEQGVTTSAGAPITSVTYILSEGSTNRFQFTVTSTGSISNVIPTPP